MFEKILFPTDGSAHSQGTLKYVKDLAEKFNSEVLIFNSYDVPAFYTIDHEEKLQENGFKILESTKKEFEGLNVQTKLLKGNSGKLIVETAEEEKCNVIIMGTHGMSEIKSILLGGTSNFVIHHTKIPIMLV